MSDEPPSDMDWSLDLMSALLSGRDNSYVFATVIEGVPPSKMRPRFNRKTGSAFTPKESREAEKITKAHLQAVVDSAGEFFSISHVPFSGNVALGCVFFRPTLQRVDVDNMVKHVSDAATGVLWADDSQVTCVFARAEYDPTRPRSIIIAGDTESSLKRGDAAGIECVICGRWVPRASGRQNKTCGSSACQAGVKGYTSLDSPVRCEACDRPFIRGTKAQRFCSPECSHASFAGKRRAAAAPRSRCLDCDKELSHLRGGRCRECWRLAMKAQRESGR